MRKPLVFILSILLIGLMAAPVAASSPGFLLKVNGEYCQTSLDVLDGVSSVPLEFIEEVIPVKPVVQDGKIAITMNGDTLELTLGSDKAVLNGTEKMMPRDAWANDQEIMVPLRFVLENLGVRVDWNGDKHEISLTAPVLKAGLTAEQMLGQITKAMSDQGSYKMKADTIMKMEMFSDGKTESMTMSGQVSGAMQEKPLLTHVVSKMKVEELSGTEGELPEIPEEALQSEMVLDENGIYMTLPGYDGWVRMDIEGLDLGELMEQYGSQDPLKSIMQMKEYGALITYGDDLVKDGKSCGVIRVEMGPEALGQYIDSVIEQTGLLNIVSEAAGQSELEETFESIFNNMQSDVDYDMVFDYDTLLTLSMNMNMTMNMKLDIPANEETGTPEGPVQIKSTQKATYQIYDYGVKFSVPDVSQAKTMTEAMEFLMSQPDFEATV